MIISKDGDGWVPVFENPIQLETVKQSFAKCDLVEVSKIEIVVEGSFPQKPGLKPVIRRDVVRRRDILSMKAFSLIR